MRSPDHGSSAIRTSPRWFGAPPVISPYTVTPGISLSSIALRMPVIVESAAAIALADLKLIDRGIFGEREQSK